MHIGLGADHGGVHLKDALAAHLLQENHDVHDVGVHDGTSVDYPDIARSALELLADGVVDRVVLVCGTGQGMAMAANKWRGVRAAVVSDTFSATMASAHNDAQVLCLGERVVGAGLAAACVDAWLGTGFAGGRHARRVGKIEGEQPEAD